MDKHVLVEGLTGKICNFLLADLWNEYYYDMLMSWSTMLIHRCSELRSSLATGLSTAKQYEMMIWFVGNLNQLRKIVLDPPVTCCARARSYLDFYKFNNNRANFLILNHLEELNVPYFVWKIRPNGQKLQELWQFKVLMTRERP